MFRPRVPIRWDAWHQEDLVKLRHLAAVAALSLLPLGSPVLAGTASAEPTVALAGTVTPATAGAQRQGALPAGQQLSVAVSLKLRNSAGLDRFIAEVSTPGSAEHGHYLTPAQFAARYAPSQSDVQRVRAYLRGQGLTVTAVSANRQVVDVTGGAARIDAAFHTTETSYLDRADRRTFYAPDKAVSLPAGVASVVSGISGLDNVAVHHHSAVTRADESASAAPTPGLTPSQYDSAYHLDKVGGHGDGQTVALFELAGYNPANLATYDQQYGLKGPAVSTVSLDGAHYDGPAWTSGEDEVEMDSEIIRGVAPQATQVVYEAPNSDQGEIDIYNRIVSDGRATVISNSWGECEDVEADAHLDAVNDIFKEAAAQGISTFSATGDYGYQDCYSPDDPNPKDADGKPVDGYAAAVDFPASSPYDTAVGGTTLSLNSDGSYNSESAWSGGGGGESAVWDKPDWQPGSGSRTVPDVASVADPKSGFNLYTAGGRNNPAPAWSPTNGGTSAAAPLWAGFAVLYNQNAQAQSKPNLGFANPALYRIAGGPGYAGAFNDITTGTNKSGQVPQGDGGFAAGPGYDEVTGLGSPIADGLAGALLGGGN
ncbi:subtilase family serine protease [Kitasatospora sp. MAP12-15]|nr:subtilase family serine protease [Kitasatospora sp. MAP12-44]